MTQEPPKAEPSAPLPGETPSAGVSGLANPAQGKSEPHIHVGRGVCELRHCGWSGFHFHWRHRRYRSAYDGKMSDAELDEFDADCQRMSDARRAAADAR